MKLLLVCCLGVITRVLTGEADFLAAHKAAILLGLGRFGGFEVLAACSGGM